jgi:CheY-like chemotaxis protein
MSAARQSHILVVNHAPEILDLMRELLEREGYRVSTLPDVEQDLDRIVELDPDLIVIDYMWSSSGNEWTLLNLITIDPRTTDIPVIVCTAAIRHVEEMRGHLERVGVRVIHKPFNISDLLEAVAGSLDEATVVESAQADGLEGQPMS